MIRMSATTIQRSLIRITTIMAARARMVTLGMMGMLIITHTGEITLLSQ